MRTYLAVSTMYRDHADDLQEWIEFHLLMGVERFLMYNNGSTDHHREVLAPYIEEGIVEVHDWPEVPGLLPAMRHCVATYKGDSRWIAFIDIDEFLYAPNGTPLPEVLRDYEDAAGVGVQRYPFGTSGHEQRPPGLVIENYLRRATVVNNIIKSIVDPTRVDRVIGAHHFVYLDGQCAVDELKRRLDPETEVEGNPGQMLPGHMYAQSFSVERLRINHYQTKSAAEFEQKMALPTPDYGRDRKPPRLDYFLNRLDATEDRDILRFAPALHDALRRRNDNSRGRA
jgi:hypothetical protein